jgi:hypothetical protein
LRADLLLRDLAILRILAPPNTPNFGPLWESMAGRFIHPQDESGIVGKYVIKSERRRSAS